MARKKEIKISGLDDNEMVAEQTAHAATDSPSSKKEAENVADDSNTTSSKTIEPELSEEERLRNQVADLEDRLLRAAADYDNYRKRMIRQQDDMVRNANIRMLSELLEVVDNFERALAHTNDDNNVDAVRQGMEMIYGQLTGLLDKHQVKPIESVGQKFDPEVHEALLQVNSEEHEEGMIATEISKGYLIGDRVLRHAKVGVSTGKAGSENNDSEK